MITGPPCGSLSNENTVTDCILEGNDPLFLQTLMLTIHDLLQTCLTASHLRVVSGYQWSDGRFRYFGESESEVLMHSQAIFSLSSDTEVTTTLTVAGAVRIDVWVPETLFIAYSAVENICNDPKTLTGVEASNGLFKLFMA